MPELWHPAFVYSSFALKTQTAVTSAVAIPRRTSMLLATPRLMIIRSFSLRARRGLVVLLQGRVHVCGRNGPLLQLPVESSQVT